MLGAALLTKGDYSRDVGWDGNKRQLGSSRKDDSWTGHAHHGIAKCPEWNL